MRKSNLAIGLLLGTFAAASAQSLSTWTKYKNIVVNTKASGANVAANVANFPVLVRLDSLNAADVFSGTLTGGADLRFAKTNGTTLLPYEIEHWDATAKRAAIWVLADTVKGNDSLVALRMYWGRTGVISASSSAAVFDTAHNWRAVYHMNGKTAVTENDATINAVHMSASDSVAGAVPTDTTGVIGGARVFAGNAGTIEGRQYFVANNTASHASVNWATSNPHTVSAWVYARAISATNNHGNSIFNKGDRQFAMQIYGATGATAKLWESAIFTSTWRQAKSKGVAVAGSWYHITGTWSGAADSTAKLYVNGVLDTTLPLGVGTLASVHTYNLFIGANPSAGSNTTAPGTSRSLAGGTSANPRFWNGYIDEVSLSRGARSAEFVKLSYETQKPAASAVAVGATQNVTVTPVAVTNVRYLLPGVQGSPNAPRDTLVFTVNTPVNLPLQYDGGPADSALLTGNTVTLPAGLAIDKLTGRLSGTPTALFAAANRTLTVYGSAGNDTRGLRLSVVAGPLAGLTYAQDTAVYVVGIPINANSASWSSLGRNPTGFSVNPGLPAGLSINPTTGAISGNPSAAVAAANYTVKAFNATDTVSRVLRLSAISVAAEDYAGAAWPNKQLVYLNTQGNGAAVTGTVTNFPVLVRLDSTSFNAGFGQAVASGADIRFTKLNNTTRLPHQIERWDAVAKKAEIWVLVDSVKGDAVSSLRMHWGNATAPNLSSGPSVFDTAAGFQAVWHMNSTSGNELDASPNGFSATATNAPGTGAGNIGPARTFNGTNQYFVAPGSAAGKLSFTQADSYTLSAWQNPAAISTAGNTGHVVVGKGNNQYALATYGASTEDRYWEVVIRGNNAYNQCLSDGSFAGSTAILATSSAGAWNHQVGIYSGGAVGSPVTQRLYFNGVLVNECQFSNDTPDGRNENFNVYVGALAEGTAPGTTFSRYWNGALDEVRLASRARSGDWVKLEYQNQRAAQTLVSFSPPTSIGPQAAASTLAQGFTVTGAGQGLAFSMNKAHEGKAVMSLMDMRGRPVWSGAFAAGSTQLLWNGSVKGGAAAGTGVYVARLTLLNNMGQIVQVQDRKVPFTR